MQDSKKESKIEPEYRETAGTNSTQHVSNKCDSGEKIEANKPGDIFWLSSTSAKLELFSKPVGLGSRM